ncbi:3-ketoacyl-CoA synthase 6 [Vitis vinifera]|uniref:3-ketoacyl-CoA synthase 6 n=1 Tax=Vitis vinifera TaxID=29760 RepID=A0A438DAB7_VITVI|nr:3-ketoacyl-CoA synthase 6 [Vitis vinifera]
MPNFSTSVKLKYVKLGYQYLVNHILTFLLIPIMVGVVIELLSLGPDQIYEIWNSLHFNLLQVLCSSFFIIFIATVYFMSKPRSIYLVDYACFKPPVTCRVPFATFMEHSRLINSDNPRALSSKCEFLRGLALAKRPVCLLPITIFLPNPPWKLQGVKLSLSSSLLSTIS